MHITEQPRTIVLTPMPEGDYQAACGGLSARAPTAAEAESALLELFQLRWQERHLLQPMPLVQEDEILDEETPETGG